MWVVVIIAAVLVGMWGWWFYKQSQPLSEDEVAWLAERRRRRAIDQHFNFSPEPAAMDLAFKASMKPDGAFHSVDYPIEAALSIVAAHQKYKKHEWVVLLICRDRKAISMWCNKGPDGTQVSPSIPVEQIAAIAARIGADTVVRAHNHPNSYGGRISLLAPSGQDLRSAEHLGELFISKSISFLDVVCERGRWLVFADRHPDDRFPLHEMREAVTAANHTCARTHRRLRRELR
jgi:hypothetical protein